jgi:hypothetical protein
MLNSSPERTLNDTPRSHTRGQIKHRFAITTEAVAINLEQIMIGRGSSGPLLKMSAKKARVTIV